MATTPLKAAKTKPARPEAPPPVSPFKLRKMVESERSATPTTDTFMTSTVDNTSFLTGLTLDEEKHDDNCSSSSESSNSTIESAVTSKKSRSTRKSRHTKASTQPSEPEFDLTYPESFVLKRSTLNRQSMSATQLNVGKTMAGMPGNLSLSPMDTKKYFGNEGRAHFFERCKWLNNQILISSKTKTDTTESLFFDNESEELDVAVEDYAFAPRRLDSPFCRVDTTHMESTGNLPFASPYSHPYSNEDLDIFEDNEEDEGMESLISGMESVSVDHRAPPVNPLSKLTTPVMSRPRTATKEPNLLSPSSVPMLRPFTASSFGGTRGSMMMSGVPDLSELGSVESSVRFHGTIPSEEEAEPVSPRTKYIAGCVREGINPRPSLIVRKLYSKELNLKHQGMGDQMAVLLADSLRNLPYVQSIDLSDNNLTDVGMSPILLAIITIPNLLELNLSNNIIGTEAAEALSSYLSAPNCSLVRLILQDADVDDFECERFVEAISHSKCLKEVDLSNNKLGCAENLNTVMPDLVTGGEAIAELLRSPSCPLESLKLAWNMLRLDGAIDLVSSLSVNTTLTYIDLSFNALGRPGGEQLGDAIIGNRTLNTLVVSNNSLDACACFTICVGVIENMALSRVSMDGNPVGEPGAKSLMQVPMCVGSRVKISAVGCNLSIRDVNCWFDYNNPCKTYALQLSNPFERAVAFAILHILATHQTFVCRKASFEPYVPKGTKGGRQKPEPLEFVQSIAYDKEEFFNDAQKATVEGLRRMKLAADKPVLAAKLFQEMDADGGGELDHEEFKELLDHIGLDMPMEVVDDILKQFDIDGGGTITFDELLLFLRQQLGNANNRLKDLLESPIMVLKSNPSQRYIPPREGVLNMDICDGFLKKDIYQSISSCDREFILESAKNSTDTVQMLGYAVKNTKIRLNEAMNLYDIIYKESRNKVKAMMILLPYTADPMEARQLVSTVTNDDPLEMQQIKIGVGAALRPIFGMPDGYYHLDMSNELNRVCVARLLEMSKTINSKRLKSSPIMEGFVGDTSQKGNWSCFRNEMFNQVPTIISSEAFIPMPTRGMLEFDFVLGSRPTCDDIFLHDHRFLKVMQNNCLVGDKEADNILVYFRKSQKEKAARWERITSGEELPVPIPLKPGVVPKGRPHCEQIFNFSEQFYDNLANRGEIFLHDTKAEEIKVNYLLSRDGNNQADDDKSSSSKSKTRSPKKSSSKEGRNDDDSHGGHTPIKPKSSGKKASLLNLQATVSTTKKGIDVLDEYAYIFSAKDGDLWKAVPEIESFGAKGEFEVDRVAQLHERKLAMRKLNFKKLLASHVVSNQAKASRVVESLESTLGKVWILSRQLAFLVSHFRQGRLWKSNGFGTYRVEIIVLLFSRLVDLQNFQMVLDKLDPEEIACIHCRIGILKFFNPMYLDGYHMMNLGRSIEVRVVAKILIALSVVEPGVNWIDSQFRWDMVQDPMPGWELTTSWMNDATMYCHGIVSMSYVTCEVANSFRKSLFNLVAMRENDFVYEDQWAAAHPKLDIDKKMAEGDHHMLGNLEMWNRLLAVHTTFRKHLAEQAKEAKAATMPANVLAKPSGKEGKKGKGAPAKAKKKKK